MMLAQTQSADLARLRRAAIQRVARPARSALHPAVHLTVLLSGYNFRLKAIEDLLFERNIGIGILMAVAVVASLFFIQV